jgi:hypothetical protein
MVRRWSPVNLMNCFTETSSRTFDRASGVVIFKENLYFKKKVRTFSFVTRRSWARRKHINQWLVYHNVLVNWASDYRFFTRYVRAMLVQNLFKNSFLTYNFLMLKKVPSSSFQGSEHFLYSFTTRKVFNYFLKYQTTSFNIFNFIRHYNIFRLTQPKVPTALQPTSLTHLQTTYSFSQNTIFAPLWQPSLNNTQPLLHILELLNNLTLVKATEVYKVYVLLTLTQLLPAN